MVLKAVISWMKVLVSPFLVASLLTRTQILSQFTNPASLENLQITAKILKIK